MRPDDLSAHVNALLEATPGLEAVQVDEVVWGRAGLDAAMIASRAVETGDASVVVDGGVEAVDHLAGECNELLGAFQVLVRQGRHPQLVPDCIYPLTYRNN